MKRNALWRTARVAVAVLVFLAACVAFSGLHAKTAMLLHVQAAPAVLKCLAAFSFGTLAVAVAIALITLLFGRVYCAAFCPFGILQDAIGYASRRKSSVVRNFVKTRLLIAGLAFGMLVAGWTAPFLLLDPYSNFGRVAHMAAALSFSLGALIPLVAIAVLAAWKKRIFCTAICPVGTALGLLSRISVFRLRLTERCVKCGMCVKVCPAGCIDPKNGTLDNERCVRCMNCVAVCRLQGVRFGIAKRTRNGEGSSGAGAFDESRRAFLVRGTVLFAGLAAGAALARLGAAKLAELARGLRILPPGAGDAARFLAKCTACQLCTANCPSKIIVPAPGGDGPVSLDFAKGYCQADCNRCSQVCPTGAIRPLPLDVKRRTKIAEAKFNPRTCIVFQEGVQCGKCAQVCPTGAITLRKTGPRLNAKLCIGCGACQHVCPATEKAMVANPIERQELLAESSAKA